MLNRLIFGKSIALHLGVLFFTLFSIISVLIISESYSSSIKNSKTKELEEKKNKRVIIDLLLEQEETRIANIINSYTSKLSLNKNNNELIFEEGQENLDLFFIRDIKTDSVLNLSFSIYNTNEISKGIVKELKSSGFDFMFQYVDDTYYSMLVYSKEILDENTGRVTGYVYGGTILNDNIDFIEKMRDKLGGDYVGISIFNKIISSITTIKYEKVGFPIYEFLKSKDDKRGFKDFIVVKEEIYEYRQKPLTLIYSFKDEIYPTIKKDFLNLVVFVLFSLVFTIFLVMLFAKNMILAPLQKLVNLFEHFNEDGFIVSKTSTGIKEFDLIKNQLIELIEKLDENRSFVAQILEGAPIAIYYKTKDGEFAGCNKRFLDIFGFKDKKEVLGKHSTKVFPSNSHVKILEQDELVVSSPKEVHNFYTNEIRQDNGEILDLLIYKKAILDMTGEINGVIGAILDISEEKKLQRDLEESKRELLELNRNLESKVREEVEIRLSTEKEKQKQQDLMFQQSKMAAMGEMIGSIAHQWKQPLNTLNILVQNIQDAHEYNELDEETIKTVVSSSKKQVGYMSKTIDDFRNFFKPSKIKEEFLVKDIVDETLGIVSYQLMKNSIEVKILGDVDLKLMGTPNEFKQVVINLINNSKDVFVEKQSFDNYVEIELIEEKEKKIIKLRDNAGGINPELLPKKIFEAYESTKGEKGTGLGLYMSKLIIEESFSGDLSARNTKDGAEFIITI